MTTLDWTIRAEIINQLYYRRFFRQAPGHSEPVEINKDPNDLENRIQYNKWIEAQAVWDAVDMIANLRNALASIRETCPADPDTTEDFQDAWNKMEMLLER